MTILSAANSKCRSLPLRRVSLIDLIALYRQRKALSRLDDRMLNDLGLNRKDAETEARRPIWDFPLQ